MSVLLQIHRADEISTRAPTLRKEKGKPTNFNDDDNRRFKNESATCYRSEQLPVSNSQSGAYTSWRELLAKL